MQYRKIPVVRTLNQQEMPSEQRETVNEEVLTFYAELLLFNSE